MPLIKLVVLGAPGCGKTSIIKQFVHHTFDGGDDERSAAPPPYKPTRTKQLYYPTIIMEERLYELQIIDLPPINFVPRNSYEEWNHFRGYGVRNAQAYLLVFDITSAQSFQFVKSIRDQLCAIKNDPVIVIAGNKQDLLIHNNNHHNNNNPNNCNEQHQSNGNYNNNLNEVNNGICTLANHYNNHNDFMNSHKHHHHNGSSQNHNDPQNAATTARHSGSSGDMNKEFAAIARKQWKCSYVECSAKFNWRVTTIFSALMKAIDRSDDIHKQGASHAQGHNGRRKCTIL